MENKDEVEERLFFLHRDLASQVRLAFFDTRSRFFCKEGGNLRARAYSPDRQPDLNQVVVAALVSEDGRPIACEVWPGSF